MNIPRLETARLILRGFVPQDAATYAERIYADPLVVKFLPVRDVPPQLRAENAIRRINEHWEWYGFGLWAVVYKATSELIGHCGLQHVWESPEIELAYALAQSYWGQGLATEAARASVAFGFEQLNLDRLVAIALPANRASRRVMEHCGLVYERDSEFFDMPVAYYALERADYLSKKNTFSPLSRGKAKEGA